MALAVAAGAALEVVFGELLKVVVRGIKQTAKFSTQLSRLEKTLNKGAPVFNEIMQLSKKLNRLDDETIEFTRYLEEGTELVVECSKIKSWNLRKRYIYTNKLIQLDKALLRFFRIEEGANVARFVRMNLVGTNELNDKFDQVILTAGGFSGSCRVTGLPKFVIGLDQHLAELKDLLLKDATRVLVLSAPGGFGKTTLAKKLCHDEEIRGVFGDNILYVTASKEASVESIAQDLFKHYGINDFKIKNKEHTKNQIENLIGQKGLGKMLLVLDNIWSEEVIEDLKFEIPGYKILVTSRSLFKKFNSYKLNLLDAEDAKILFCHSAFPNDGISVNLPIDLVNKMVKVCNRLPLALTVVGASLCGEPEIVWRSTFKKWSEGQSILESHDKLLACLQTSVNALDELHNSVKECFLDLCSFPEDDHIAGTTLMDMWIELYNLDDDIASINLLLLASRNLINLVSIRKVAGEMEGHCSQYRVTQHDMLRELAVHLSRQEPEAKRRRLFMETQGNNFPKWLIKQPADAHILSILTDGELSSTWDDLNAPNVEVLIMNIRSENYTLPQFIEKMSQLKVLIITGYGVYPTQLDNLQVLASLSKLSRIRFEHVSVTPPIQVVFTLKTLKKLTFVMCKIGDALNSGTTGSPYMLENLKHFAIDLCYDLKELPAGLCSSVHLQKLIITNCQELDALPKELGNLSNLEILGLHCCTKLKELPESIGSLRKLSSIDISNCSHISALPKQIGELSSLSVIDISGCEGLEKLPKSLVELKQLEVVICDEERSYLWKNIATDHCKVKINLVEEDIFGTLKKICP